MHFFDFLGHDTGRTLTAILLIMLEMGGYLVVLRLIQFYIGSSQGGRMIGLAVSVMLGLVWSRYYALTYSRLITSNPEHLITLVIVGTAGNVVLASWLFRHER